MAQGTVEFFWVQHGRNTSFGSMDFTGNGDVGRNEFWFA
jgi:hypothetical protein